MDQSIVITGGSGVLGSALVNRLQENGRTFLTVSRSKRESHTYDRAAAVIGETAPWRYVDLATGEGLSNALNRKPVIIHLASGMGKVNGVPMEIVFARNLLREAHISKADHLLYMSIVGIDKIPSPYYRAKLEVEEMIRQSGIPYTILRATQFHNFLEHQVRNIFRFPLAIFPATLKFQPIAVDAVVDKLIEISAGAPQYSTVEIGGPQVLSLREMVDIWSSVTGIRKRIISIPAFGSMMKALEQGFATTKCADSNHDDWSRYLVRRHHHDAVNVMISDCHVQ